MFITPHYRLMARMIEWTTKKEIEMISKSYRSMFKLFVNLPKTTPVVWIEELIGNIIIELKQTNVRSNIRITVREEGRRPTLE